MRIYNPVAYCCCLLGLVFAQQHAVNHLPRRLHKRDLKGGKNRYFFGMWEGIDPLDGTNMQRIFIPIASNNYTVTGRIEYSEICGSGTEPGINITAPPNKTSNLIPALIGGFGKVDQEGSLNAKVSLTCFGEDKPRIPTISVEYEPIEENVLLERPSFRAQFPIYFFRTSQPVGRLYKE